MFRMNSDIGIDLGTATVLVYSKNRGIVLKEPSVVAIDRSEKGVDTILKVGEEARQMIGRTPGNIFAIRPLRDGVISDYDITEKMLKYFINKACGRKRWFAPRVTICIPCEATPVERKAIRDAAQSAGAKRVELIEEPIAAAIGAGLDITRASGNMIIDIGGGTTDIAVISLKSMVVHKSIKVAGDVFDEAIIKYIKKKHKVMIGERTAEELKIKIGCVYDPDPNNYLEVRGRDLLNGLPTNIVVNAEEMQEALREAVNSIADSTHSVLERTPPELAADIADKGIIMTGGGALLDGLDRLIEARTKVPVYVAEDSISCVAYGTGKVLSCFDNY